MTKLFIHDEKGEVTDVIESVMIRTAAEFDLMGGHEKIFDLVKRVKSSPDTYFLPRGEMSNGQIAWPFKADRTELEKHQEWLEEHRALLTAYVALRFAGHMPQVVYIVTFCDRSEHTPELIDRAASGARFLEGTKFYATEHARLVEAPLERSARAAIGHVDDMLKTAYKPEDTRPLFELRGKLSLMIDRAAAQQKKGV